jgi:hypothetical protein
MGRLVCARPHDPALRRAWAGADLTTSLAAYHPRHAKCILARVGLFRCPWMLGCFPKYLPMNPLLHGPFSMPTLAKFHPCQMNACSWGEVDSFSQTPPTRPPVSFQGVQTFGERGGAPPAAAAFVFIERKCNGWIGHWGAGRFAAGRVVPGRGPSRAPQAGRVRSASVTPVTVGSWPNCTPGRTTAGNHPINRPRIFPRF